MTHRAGLPSRIIRAPVRNTAVYNTVLFAKYWPRECNTPVQEFGPGRSSNELIEGSPSSFTRPSSGGAVTTCLSAPPCSPSTAPCVPPAAWDPLVTLR